ncbi:hypothetical protein BJ165DRAFT_1516519 [Panaeolus papilionaceus]|nr:hypothetical protein BJ165DRAFT_1516519 [Panaeolus papilionaceus]
MIACPSLFGTTGVGKSAFVEAICPDQGLGISKDGLESVTQTTILYSVDNLEHSNRPIIIMDTPGFRDLRLSESRITQMIKKSVQSLHETTRSVAVTILYLDSIDVIRLAGSRRTLVQLLDEYQKALGVKEVLIVSTMWNQISTPKRLVNAQQRFAEMQRSSTPRKVFRFDPTRDSALDIIDNISPEVFRPGWAGTDAVDVQHPSLLRDGLLDRIAMVQQQLNVLMDDKHAALTPANENSQLLMAIHRDSQAVMLTLQSFYDDLYFIDPEGLRSLLGIAPLASGPSESRPIYFISRFKRLLRMFK